MTIFDCVLLPPYHGSSWVAMYTSPLLMCSSKSKSGGMVGFSFLPCPLYYQCVIHQHPLVHDCSLLASSVSSALSMCNPSSSPGPWLLLLTAVYAFMIVHHVSQNRHSVVTVSNGQWAYICLWLHIQGYRTLEILSPKPDCMKHLAEHQANIWGSIYYLD